ncbi:hypothetical protein MLD38_012124 [Melastoma candidum]|uniref:Uncharacterized protein n=1 Tax=Melastoma candidum TaxID=119954 RepID=A0ACB9R4R7_9MYRT|nr:hypothetical protein MLD38_012124 [Melastoma candidum]
MAGYQQIQVENSSSSLGRRSGHYNPNVWDYSFLQSLCRRDSVETMKSVATLVEDVKTAFHRAMNMDAELELVDCVARFGISDLFRKEIEDAFVKLRNSAATTSTGNDGNKEDCSEPPLHWRVPWFDVKRQIESYEGRGANLDLLRLAKLNFNHLQAVHQSDLGEVSRWWLDLGLMKDVDFTRDRLVESFLMALGLAHEPRFSQMRKSLAKVIVMVLVIDDVYDLFGSFQELECFTDGVNRWDPAIIEQLPKCLRVCFKAVYNVTHEIAHEIGRENHSNSVVTHLKKAWADFCNAMFVEAKWYSASHVPSLDEYLENAWVSSSGPLILSHAYFLVGDVDPVAVPGLLQKNKDLIYNSSMIIRLCNDLATSEKEHIRGDVPSSVICHMLEANVSEDIARKHIQGLINKAWKNINELCIADGYPSPRSSRACIDVTVNAARVAHRVYQFGDSFGEQDKDIRAQILSIIIKPFTTGLDELEDLCDDI